MAYRHPIWPPRWFVICGAVGFAFYVLALAFIGYAAVHYILKFW